MTEADIGRVSLDAAYLYAANVRAGEIPACKWTRLAVDRWFADLENGHERGLRFDENAAARVFRFFNYCRHYQGEWAGHPIRLEPWQCFIVANVYGWQLDNGTRRFRMVYEEIPRKNGKTTKLGGIGLYGLHGDGEPGPKVYSAATKRDQAKELFESSKAMVLQSPELKKLTKVFQGHLSSPRHFGRFEPLSADAKSMDGLNVHYGLVDELHAHPTPQVWDVIKSARGARRQPLQWAITTAGFNRNGICYELRDYACKVLEGVVEDDAFFTIIYTIDDGDQFDDPVAWQKANPNFGVSVSPKDLEDQCRMAMAMPTELTEFLTKRLNVWTYGESKWMNMEAWKECQVEFDALAPWGEDDCELDGETCFGGLDLASVEDLTALYLVFAMPGGRKRVIGRAYLPQEKLEQRLAKGNNFFEQWRTSGFLTVTPGAVTDYEYIKEDIRRACSRFHVQEIAYDRFNSSQLVNDLMEEEVPMVAMGQGFASMNAPMKELQRIVLTRQLEHNDPLLTWAVSNLVADQNPAGDIKPNKSKVSEKIDPAVAVIMALGRQMVQEPDGSLDDFLSNPILT